MTLYCTRRGVTGLSPHRLGALSRGAHRQPPMTPVNHGATDLLTWTALLKHRTGALEPGSQRLQGTGTDDASTRAPHWPTRPSLPGLVRGRVPGEARPAPGCQRGTGARGPGRDTLGMGEVRGSSTSGPMGLSLDAAMGALPAVGNPPSALAPAPCPSAAPTEAGAVGAAWERELPAKHVRMREGCRRDTLQEQKASSSASQRPGMSFNPSAHMSTFRGLPFLPAAPVPTHQLFWEPPLAPRMTAPISQGNPLVLSAYPGPPYVPGLSTFEQHGPQLRPEGPPHIQNIAHTQAPLNYRAPGAFCGGVENPSPFLTAPSALRTTVPTSDCRGIQNHGGNCHLGLSPPAPPPFTDLAPIVFPMHACQWPGTEYGEGALPTFQATVPPDDSSEPQSNYEDFRHSQHFKTLVHRHLPQTPDVEALSCFLVPVPRSLSELEPTITMEETLWKGLQEWQHTSNFDRMAFYETAEKYMEFEAAGEMEDPRMQLSGVFQCQPPSVSLRRDFPRPPAPKAVQQPVCNSRKTTPKAQCAHSVPAKRKAPETKMCETKAPEEIPPEAIQELMDIMDELVGPTNFATWEPFHLSIEEIAANLGEEGLDHQPMEDDLYPDPSLLSYIDEGFVNKMETMINPHFLEELLSSEPYLNIVDLTKQLEQEEGLIPNQDSRASEAPASQGAEKRKHCSDQGVSTQNWPPEVTSQDVKRRRATEPELLGPKDTAILPSCQVSPSLGAIQSNHPPQNGRSSFLNLRGKGVGGHRGATSSGGPHGTANGCSVDDGLQCLDFLQVSQHRLLPWALCQSQGPHMEPLCSGDQAPQAPPSQTGSLLPHPPPAAMSKKSALTGRSHNTEKMPRPRAPLEVTGGKDLHLKQVRTSQPQKRKCKAPGNSKKKRRLYGQ
uniref:NUT family member 2G-like n=1 Tax=Callospermophilus lateralis TaxID=76772 RepID=UPI0040388F1F